MNKLWRRKQKARARDRKLRRRHAERVRYLESQGYRVISVDHLGSLSMWRGQR